MRPACGAVIRRLPLTAEPVRRGLHADDTGHPEDAVRLGIEAHSQP